MITGVTSGYGNRAQIPNAIVGGKTGTAQLGGDANPHAWFLGFAQRGDATVVIVVMVENAGNGSTVSAPIFAKVAGPALDAASTPVKGVK
jgi:penicillin-binding protein A